ncbi:hypothetical protein [Amycolatopsis rubida]|uniref:Uncharacterized protein n=1 Tax=Amycolatopsis rubida TaxID=112413 RepID=A0A1I5XI18_9PSEU|nr:hypothetical protein [Amycolatopsis rubida]SFQ31601.1 hypothetical protein SAMN05421854_110249 [Amycolatopsis rubida]
MSEYILSAKSGLDLYAVWSGNNGFPVAIGTRAQIAARQVAAGVPSGKIGCALDLAASTGTSNPRGDGSWDDEMISADCNRALLPRYLLGDYLNKWQAGRFEECADLLDFPGRPAAHQDAADDEPDEDECPDEPIAVSGPPTRVSLPAAVVDADLRILRGFRQHGTINAVRPATVSGRPFLTRHAVIAPEIDLTTRAGLRLILRHDRDPFYPGYETWHVTTAAGEPVRVGGPGTELIDDCRDLPLEEADAACLDSVLRQLWDGVTAAWRASLTALAPAIAAEFTASGRGESDHDRT